MQARFMNQGSRKLAGILVGGMGLLWTASSLAANWTPLVTANSPSNVHHDATYDSANQRIVLCGRDNVGGNPTGQARCYFFTLAGGWQEGPAINSTGKGSEIMNDIEVSYDTDRGVSVLYTITNNLPLVFELVNNVWTQRAFATPPVVCADGALMRYDPIRKNTVLVGSTNMPDAASNSETWLWDGTNWTQVAGSPPGAAGGSMTFDEARGVMVLLPYYATNTWTFDGTAWTPHQTAHVPDPAVWVGKMAYDPVNELAIQFGGEKTPATYPTNIWAWNGSDWQMLTTATCPPDTIDMAMLWFPPLNAIVMHGGWGDSDSWVWRNTVWGFSNAPALPAPEGVTASAGTYSDKVAVHWSPVASATGYRVFRAESDDTALAALLGASTTTNYNDTSAVAGTTYWYWVKATNASGISALSSSASGYRSGGGSAPAAPTGISASKGTHQNKVCIHWDLVTNATSYQVWRNTTDASGSATKFETEPTANSFDDETATVGTLYYYWVKAKNAAGASGFSSSDSGYARGAYIVVTADFDGDGKADPALYVEAAGNWYVKLSASGYGLVTLPFGGPGYVAVDGDFDGDGKADPTLYQESTGLWQVQLSGSGYAVATMTSFGGTEYEAVAGDYDGDGKADPAIYNTTSGEWQVAMSSQGYGIATVTGVGGAGYSAVQENYDSDHRTDAAIYNNANGNWTVLLSAQNYITATVWGFGGEAYEPVLGDFDGDGLADPAIYEDTTGNWQVKLSGSGYATAELTGFGGAQTLAAAADYDGDRKADPIYLDGATGIWHVKLSASGYAEATTASGYTP